MLQIAIAFSRIILRKRQIIITRTCMLASMVAQRFYIERWKCVLHSHMIVFARHPRRPLKPAMRMRMALLTIARAILFLSLPGKP